MEFQNPFIFFAAIANVLRLGATFSTMVSNWRNGQSRKASFFQDGPNLPAIEIKAFGWQFLLKI